MLERGEFEMNLKEGLSRKQAFMFQDSFLLDKKSFNSLNLELVDAIAKQNNHREIQRCKLELNFHQKKISYSAIEPDNFSPAPVWM